jgi:serine/threonine protein kinase
MDDDITKKETEETQISKKDFVKPSHDDLSGKTIGDYRFIKELGRGGMAIVYEAHQISLDRDVAVKIIPKTLIEDPEYLERFKREASSAANLNHSNIVSIHGFGQFGDLYYYAMDLEHGKTLENVIQDKKHELLKKAKVFKIDEALSIVLQAASALSYAHKHGIVHRDIKPSNLIIDTEANRILITDFGLAKSNRWEKITPTASLFGTPAYMSPEQASGKDVDRRTDIYSLGAVFYEMLTGALPYSGSNALEVIDKVKTDPIVSPRSINPSIPVEIEYIILKAMSRDLKLRYNSMDDFLNDLARFQQGEKVDTFIKIARKRTIEKPINRKWVRFAIVLAIGFIALICTFFMLDYSKKREKIRDIESTLQLAENYEQLNMKSEAIRVYKEVIERYPNTSYSKIAEEKLSKYSPINR